MPTVAMVVSTVGYHWEEVLDAYREFTQAGFAVNFFTVNGKPAKADPVSLKRTRILNRLGYGVPGRIAPESAPGRELQDRLKKVRPVSQIDANHTDVLYLSGGHGCLFDMNRNENLHRKIEQLYHNHKLLSGVCHATSTFAQVFDHGKPITRNKKITGFPEMLDRIMLRTGGIYRDYLPLPLSNDRLLQEGGEQAECLEPALGGDESRLCSPGYAVFHGCRS